MPRNKPPFRADVVGSILRTAPLKEARAKREKGEISAAQLKEVEDREIEKIIKKQEEVGLQGRHRRRIPPLVVAFRLLRHARRRRDLRARSRHPVPGRADQARAPHHTASSASRSHPMLEHFKFLKAHTRVTPKMCIPSPATLHFRLEPNAVATKEYADRDAIFDDLAKTYRQAIRGFYDAGCRYLQIRRHRLGLSVLAGRAEKGARARPQCRPSGAGLCPRHQQRAGRQAGRHDDHDPICRGNFRSTWISEGGYEPVAEICSGN